MKNMAYPVCLTLLPSAGVAMLGPMTNRVGFLKGQTDRSNPGEEE